MKSVHLQFPAPLLLHLLFDLNHFVIYLAINTEIVKHTPPSIETITLRFPPYDRSFGLEILPLRDLRPWDQQEFSGGWQSMDAALTRLPALTTVQFVLSNEVNIGDSRRTYPPRWRIITTGAGTDSLVGQERLSDE